MFSDPPGPADITGIHPVLTRRFEYRLQQGLASDERNLDVLFQLAEIDAYFLPFLNHNLILQAITDLPCENPSVAPRWRLFARCIEHNCDLPFVVDKLADYPDGDVIAWRILARVAPAYTGPVLDAMEHRGTARFLAFMAAVVCERRETLLSTVSRASRAPERWCLIGRVLAHAADLTEALTTNRFFVAAGVDPSVFTNAPRLT